MATTSPPGEREVLSIPAQLPASGPGSKKRRRWFLGVFAAVVVLLLFELREIILPFVLGVVLAYVLSPLVELGQQLHVRGHHPPRWLVVLALYITLIGMLVALVTFSGPRLAAETGRLSKEAPRAVAEIRQRWLPELDRRLRDATAPYLPASRPETDAAPGTAISNDLAALEVRPRPGGGYEVVLPPSGLRVVQESGRVYRIEPASPRGKIRPDLASAVTTALGHTMDNTEQTGVAVLQAAQHFITKLVRGVFGFLLTIVVSAYLLITSARIFDFARLLFAPARRADFDDIVRRIDGGLSGVVRGQLIICAINGALSGIGFYILGLKYWTFLTLLAALMSIIPIFGSFLSSVPAVLVALTQDFSLALFVLAWIVGIHQLEAHVLNPKIMGDAARVHPVLVVFALLAGEHVAGLVGALLAVPVLSVTQTLFLYLRERFLGVPRSSSMPPPTTHMGFGVSEQASTAPPAPGPTGAS